MAQVKKGFLRYFRRRIYRRWLAELFFLTFLIFLHPNLGAADEPPRSMQECLNLIPVCPLGGWYTYEQTINCWCTWGLCPWSVVIVKDDSCCRDTGWIRYECPGVGSYFCEWDSGEQCTESGCC